MEAYYSVQRFSDPDEHAQSFSNFDQSYVQIETGPFQSSLLQADLGGLHVFAESANRRIVERAHVLPGSVAVGWMHGAVPSSVGYSRGGEDWLVDLPAGA